MTKVLFLGCHADDIELGCGATIHKHKNDWDIHCVTLSGNSYSPLGIHGDYPDIWRQQQKALVGLGVKQMQWLQFKTNYFNEQRDQIYIDLRSILDKLKPDIVYTQEEDDNLDHTVLYGESLRTCQSYTLLTYHIPRSQAVFNTNYYEVVDIFDVEAKLASLKCYTMYTNKHYFQEEFIRAQMAYTGGYISRCFAEPFRAVRVIRISDCIASC